jgi:hypothetical protein
MSGYTMTQTELIYSADIAGTVTSTGVTTIQSAIVGYPAPFIPAGFFTNILSYRTSSLRIKWGGLIIATATIPTFNIGIGFSTTDAVPGTTSVGTGTVTPGATTGSWFDCEIHLAARTLVQAAATSSISVHGAFTIMGNTAAANTPVVYAIPANAATYSPAATLDPTVQNWVYPVLTLGTATAGNTLTTEYLKIYGEN